MIVQSSETHNSSSLNYYEDPKAWIIMRTLKLKLLWEPWILNYHEGLEAWTDMRVKKTWSIMGLWNIDNY